MKKTKIENKKTVDTATRAIDSALFHFGKFSAPMCREAWLERDRHGLHFHPDIMPRDAVVSEKELCKTCRKQKTIRGGDVNCNCQKKFMKRCQPGTPMAQVDLESHWKNPDTPDGGWYYTYDFIGFGLLDRAMANSMTILTAVDVHGPFEEATRTFSKILTTNVALDGWETHGSCKKLWVPATKEQVRRERTTRAAQRSGEGREKVIEEFRLLSNKVWKKLLTGEAKKKVTVSVAVAENKKDGLRVAEVHLLIAPMKPALARGLIEVLNSQIIA